MRDMKGYWAIRRGGEWTTSAKRSGSKESSPLKKGTEKSIRAWAEEGQKSHDFVKEKLCNLGFARVSQYGITFNVKGDQHPLSLLHRTASSILFHLLSVSSTAFSQDHHSNHHSNFKLSGWGSSIPQTQSATHSISLRLIANVKWNPHTFLFPPVMVTFTKRRVYVILFFARPLGVFFFSWGSTCAHTKPNPSA